MSERTDVIYCYDGSFAGFLCCVFESFARQEMPTEICTDESQRQLSFCPPRTIQTDLTKAGRVWKSIPTKISQQAADMVSMGFLTCMEQKEVVLLRFLKIGYRVGGKVTQMLTNDTVHALNRAVLYLKNESHYMKEFLRFSEYASCLVAEIEPNNWVLPMIRNHYCDRFSGEHFLIYDRTHRQALVYRPFESKIIALDSLTLPNPESGEQRYRDLWEQYYESAAVKGRENPKCRMTHLPKRYWNCMTEFTNPKERQKRELLRAKRTEQIVGSNEVLGLFDLPNLF
jgi:probable DNA metabolism protein